MLTIFSNVESSPSPVWPCQLKFKCFKNVNALKNIPSESNVRHIMGISHKELSEETCLMEEDTEMHLMLIYYIR